MAETSHRALDAHVAVGATTVEAVLDALGRVDRRSVVPLLCPLHADSRPSLLVASRHQRIRCAAGCFGGQWVDPLTLFMAMGVDRQEAVRLVASSRHGRPAAAVPRVASRMAAASDPHRIALGRVVGFLDRRTRAREKVLGPSHWDPAVVSWAAERGFDLGAVGTWLAEFDSPARRALRAHFPRETLVMAGLCYDSGRWTAGPEWGVLFVYRDRAGTPVWTQAVALEAEARARCKYKNPIGISPVAFGCDTVTDATRVVVVTEGVTDALSVLQHQEYPSTSGRLSRALGRVGAIGLAGVEQRSTEWLGLLSRRHQVLVAFDPDDAGDAGAERLLSLLKKRGLAARRWRPVGGDLNKVYATGR